MRGRGEVGLSHTMQHCDVDALFFVKFKEERGKKVRRKTTVFGQQKLENGAT